MRGIDLARKSQLKNDRVGKICQALRCKTDALFKAAFKWWKKGRLNTREVSYAHSTYQRKGKIPRWVTQFIEHLTQMGARALPA